MAAGSTIQRFVLNLSAILTPMVLVATIVVSEMKDRLSPKNAPPMMDDTVRAMLASVALASPTPNGLKAMTVPMAVPVAMETKQEDTNSPASMNRGGKTSNVTSTVASIQPIAFALLAKAPARRKIQTMSIIFELPAPRPNVRTLSIIGR